ncbi:hypothetical protein GAMM_40203 [Gammaproteobacteria bacterium]
MHNIQYTTFYKNSVFLAFLAGGLGFEPRLTESESAILPLDDPPIRKRADALFLRN